MSETPEFRPVEPPKKWAAWPFAAMGAVIVVLVVLLARKDGEARVPKQVATATIAPKPEAVQQEIAAASRPAEPVQQANAKPKTDNPNVLGAQAPAATAHAPLVPATELERERLRVRSAQKAADAYRKEVEGLKSQLAQAKGELSQAKGQISAILNPPKPPPTDQEQILRTLAPVLSNNDGRP